MSRPSNPIPLVIGAVLGVAIITTVVQRISDDGPSIDVAVLAESTTTLETEMTMSTSTEGSEGTPAPEPEVVEPEPEVVEPEPEVVEPEPEVVEPEPEVVEPEPEVVEPEEVRWDPPSELSFFVGIYAEWSLCQPRAFEGDCGAGGSAENPSGGEGPYYFDESSSDRTLPPGVHLDGYTGLISGVPEVPEECAGIQFCDYEWHVCVIPTGGWAACHSIPIAVRQG